MPTTDSKEDTIQAFFGGSTMFLASGLGNGLGYLLGIFLARLLGAEDFGLYAISLAIFNVLALLSLCGADTAVVKFVSEAIRRGDRPLASQTIAVALRFALLAGVLAALFLILSSRTWLAELYGRTQLTTALTVFALVIPVNMAVTMLLASLQADHAFRGIVAVRYLWEPLGKLALTVLAVLAGWGLIGVIGGIGVASLVSLGLAASYTQTNFPGFATGPAAGRDLAAKLARFGLPLLVMTIVGVVAPRTDVLFLGYWAEPTEAGLYQAAFQTAAILALAAAALDAAFAPLSAALLAAQDLERLKSLYKDVSRWLLTLSFPVVLLLIIFGREILSLFGPTFPLAAGCLFLLVVGQWVNNWTTFAQTILLMSGQTRLAMWNTLAFGGSLVFLNWLLIPRWGITGAAAAVSLCMALGGLLRVGQVWMLFGLHPFSPELMKPFCAGVVALSAGYWLRGLLGPEFLLGLMVGMGLLYIGLLYGMKLEESDRVALASLAQRVRGLRAV